MLNANERMVSCRMLPGALAALDAIIEYERSKNSFWPNRINRSSIILALIQREFARITEERKAELAAAAAESIEPKKPRKRAPKK